MHLLLITVGLCVSYVVLFFLFPIFFEKIGNRMTVRSVKSLVLILILSLFGYSVAFAIPDPDISNRFLHGFGGGFVMFCVCFLAIRDAGVWIGRLQFVLFSILVVTALGVVNEMVEFLLQNYLGFIATESINDTWLDLISNTVGMLLAAAVLAVSVPAKNNDTVA